MTGNAGFPHSGSEAMGNTLCKNCPTIRALSAEALQTELHIVTQVKFLSNLAICKYYRTQSLSILYL